MAFLIDSMPGFGIDWKYGDTCFASMLVCRLAYHAFKQAKRVISRRGVPMLLRLSLGFYGYNWLVRMADHWSPIPLKFPVATARLSILFGTLNSGRFTS